MLFQHDAIMSSRRFIVTHEKVWILGHEEDTHILLFVPMYPFNENNVKEHLT